MTPDEGNPDRAAAACPLKSSRPAHSSPSPKASGCRTGRWWRPSGSSSQSTKRTPCSSSIAAVRRRTIPHPPRASCRCRSTNFIERITWSRRSTPPVTSSSPQPWSESGIAENGLLLSARTAQRTAWVASEAGYESSPTSSSSSLPLRPPHILSSPSNGGRRGANSNAMTPRVSIMRAKRSSQRARRNTTTISWRLQAIAPRAMARRRS